MTQSLVSLLAAVCPRTAEDNVQLGLRLPPGFEVTEFADSKLANDIFSMTFDPRGRVVVSGRGYIRILADDDADGRAERAIDFADGPADGAQGMLWEGESLFITGDGGLRRYRDEDGDDRADGPSELIRKMKTGGEHDAHDIKRGPDGWLYVLCGNMTGIDKSFAQLSTSPIRDPVAGCVIRFTPDLQSSEIVAHGFRNSYRMDFNSDGELFTYDSDNERCVSLPWYEPTRFYHVIPGGHYGWLAPQRAQWFRLPPYFPDVVAPVAYLGRGSPTGVACYRHAQFPESYRGGMFAADWTFGRVYFLPLQRFGASYTSTPETFIEAVGENGFAPTELAVHPLTGDLFISIGGRGTRGAVYRVRYPAGVREFKRTELAQFQPRQPNASDPPRGNPATSASMAWVRRVQLAVGGIASPQSAGTIWEGYSPRHDATHFELDGETRASAIERLRGLVPSASADLEREVTRTLAMFEDDDPATLRAVAGRLAMDSSPIDDIHYLAVLARLRGKRSRSLTDQVTSALLALDRKCDERRLNRDRHWPLRVAELHAELARKDPLLNERMLADAEFGRADHVLFAQCSGFDRRRAAEIFLDRSARDEDFAWNASLVELLGSLPDSDSHGVLRKLWENLGLRDAIIEQLARSPQREDREKFLDGLNSPQLGTVGVCLDALKKLPASNDALEFLVLVRTMRRLQGGKEEDRLRERVGSFLQERTKQALAASDAEAWTAWLVRTHPELAPRLSGPDGVDAAAWHERLEKLDWPAGDAERGRAVFARTGCVACHSGARAIGPDLRGVASRFSRDDLFTAIVQPSKDVSPRYQTTLVATADGKLYQGTIIYEAVDSLIIQTGADTTIRITNSQIVERRATPNSLMPAGLLDKLNDQEIADIYTYLKSMR
jgi:putative membrane-bound dehydrogenase-like protein